MRNHNRCILVAALLVLFSPVSGAAPPAAPAAEPPDAKIFFRREDVSLAELSPTGDHIAMAVRSANGRYQLLIASTTPGATEKYVTGFDTADVVSIYWVSKDRLVVVTDDLSGAEARIGFHRAVFAINSDGSDAVPLINRDPRFQPGSLGATIRSRELPGKYQIMHTTQDGSGDVIVGEFRYNRETREMEHITPYRLNTSSRLLTPLIDTPMPERANGWFFDANGSPRAYTALNYGRRRIYYRDANSWDWRKIGDFDAVNGEGFYPRFFGVDGNLYVSQGDNGEPTALYRYDVQKMRVAPAPVLQLAGFDYDATVEMDLPSQRILGFHFLTDARGSAWLDPRYKAIQEKVDKALASTSNVVRCARFNCSGSKYLLVEAASDREPTQYLLYDPSADKLIPLAASRPDVEPRRMGQRDFYRYATRDGLSIPVYVTLPPGKRTGPLPTVVLVHGGPWARGDSWEWSSIPQFLATRGYAVVEPEFRGSVGFGFNLFHAGWRQLGLAMQDDIADATKWAIAKGYTDPSRIAIGGASYGGYATLMGLAKNPELFRCGFEWVGVTDFALVHDSSELTQSDEWLKYGWPAMIGDKDSELPSPLASAARIRQPLLMAYGRLDSTVRIEQGHKFRDAVTATNNNVEYIEYPLEGHGWYIEEDNIDFWRHVEKFLQTNLRGASN